MIKQYRTVFGEEVRMDDEKWDHITHKHPEVKPFVGKIEEVLRLPDVVKLSRRDPKAHLYYSFYN